MIVRDDCIQLANQTFTHAYVGYDYMLLTTK